MNLPAKDGLTAKIAHFLHESEIGSPEVLGCQEGGTSSSPTHLLREEGPRSVGADTGSQAQRNVLDLPATINSAESFVAHSQYALSSQTCR